MDEQQEKAILYPSKSATIRLNKLSSKSWNTASEN